MIELGVLLVIGSLFCIGLASAVRRPRRTQDEPRSLATSTKAVLAIPPEVRQTLEAIHLQLETLNRHATAANKMHGDLNKAVQWLIDKESGR